LTHPNFSIVTDPARTLIRVTMRGFWDAAAIEAYDVEIRKAAQQMSAAGCRPGDLVALVDTRELSTQSQDLLAVYKEQFGGADRQPRRLATIVSSALLKRQVERLAMPNQRLFQDEQAAMRWLFE